MREGMSYRYSNFCVNIVRQKASTRSRISAMVKNMTFLNLSTFCFHVCIGTKDQVILVSIEGTTLKHFFSALVNIMTSLNQRKCMIMQITEQGQLEKRTSLIQIDYNQSKSQISDQGKPGEVILPYQVIDHIRHYTSMNRGHHSM